jgi:hypothetical protein
VRLDIQSIITSLSYSIGGFNPLMKTSYFMDLAHFGTFWRNSAKAWFRGENTSEPTEATHPSLLLHNPRKH